MTIDDPLLVDLAGFDYTLDRKSPCIDAGLNQPWMIGATDLAGNDRILSGFVDMGAYEADYPAPGAVIILR
jgi:hypothetical protein